MVRFDCRPCVEEYAAVCTVSKGASRLKKCGKKHRAARNFENRVEGQRLLLANIMEDTWLQISPITGNLETELHQTCALKPRSGSRLGETRQQKAEHCFQRSTCCDRQHSSHLLLLALSHLYPLLLPKTKPSFQKNRP